MFNRNTLGTRVASRHITLTVAAAAVVGWPMVSYAIVYRDDMTDTMSRGLATQEQFRATGRVSGMAGGGTGSLILRDWVMTAKHVVLGNAAGTTNASFTLGGTTYGGKVYSNPESDFALIHLNGGGVPRSVATPIAPGFFSDEGGKLVWLVGYGGHKNVSGPTVVYDGRLRAGTNVVREYTNSYLYFDNGNTGSTSTAYESSTAPGDSGGPMYRQVNNAWYAVGETFGAGSNGFVHTPTHANKTFLLSTIRAATGDPSFDFPMPTAGPTRLTWDADATAEGTGDGGGTWDLQRTNFRSSDTGFNYHWDNSVANDVTFGNAAGVAGTVTIVATNLSSGTLIAGGVGPRITAGGVSAHDLTFNATRGGRYAIAGAASLTLVATAAGDPTIAANVDATIDAPIAGVAPTITKTGEATLTLGGANTFGGRLLVDAGTLLTTRAAALPSYATPDRVRVAGGATLAINVGGASQWTATQVDALRAATTFADGASLGLDTTGGAFAYDAPLAGRIGLTKLGANTLTSTSANSYTGPTLVRAGTFKFTDAEALSGGGTVEIAAGATLDMNARGEVTIANSITLAGPGVPGARGALGFTSGNIGVYTLAGGMRLAGDVTIGSFAVNHTLNFNSPIVGTGNLAFNTEGGLKNVHSFAVHFNAGSTYDGDTTLASGNGNRATYRLGVTDALPIGTRLTLKAGAGDLAFDLGGRGQRIASLVDAGVAANATVTGNGDAVLTIDVATAATYAGRITGAMGLTKGGLGVQTLAGINTYAGATRIDAGTLRIDGSLGETAVSVNAAGTLAGNGAIAGPVTNYGTIAAAGDDVGSLALEGGLTLCDGSRLAFDLSPSGSDCIVTTTLELGSNVQVYFTEADAIGVGTYGLIHYVTAIGSADNLSTWTLGGLSQSYAYRLSLGTDALRGTSTVQLSVSMVPEPATLTVLVAAAGGSLRRPTRRESPTRSPSPRIGSC